MSLDAVARRALVEANTARYRFTPETARAARAKSCARQRILRSLSARKTLTGPAVMRTLLVALEAIEELKSQVAQLTRSRDARLERFERMEKLLGPATVSRADGRNGRIRPAKNKTTHAPPKPIGPSPERDWLEAPGPRPSAADPPASPS